MLMKFICIFLFAADRHKMPYLAFWAKMRENISLKKNFFGIIFEYFFNQKFGFSFFVIESSFVPSKGTVLTPVSIGLK